MHHPPQKYTQTYQTENVFQKLFEFDMTIFLIKIQTIN